MSHVIKCRKPLLKVFLNLPGRQENVSVAHELVVLFLLIVFLYSIVLFYIDQLNLD